MLLRRLIGAAAKRHGYRASFMATPFADRSGNGLHIHASLKDRAGTNIFGDPDTGETRLRHAIAGAIATMPDFTALFIATVNGFRRVRSGYTCSRALWAENHRYTAIRLPRASGAARRLEHRVGGADANPFLVMAGLFHGMANGLEDAAEPPAAVVGHPDKAVGAPLPRTLEDALDLFSASPAAERAFGRDYVAFYTAVKRQEVEGFQNYIAPLEHQTYL